MRVTKSNPVIKMTGLNDLDVRFGRTVIILGGFRLPRSAMLGAKGFFRVNSFGFAQDQVNFIAFFLVLCILVMCLGFIFVKMGFLWFYNGWGCT